MTVKKSPAPAVPKGLERPGVALWKRFVAVYEFDLAELLVLEQVCRVADAIARLEASDESPTQLRLHRVTFVKLLGQLQLPSSDDPVPRNMRSRRAQRAANRRWDLRDRRAGFPDGA